MEYVKKHRARIISTLLLAVGIIAAFWIFIQDNTRRIYSQNEEYLNELTTQRAISIDNLISENLNFIQSTAYLYGKSLTSPWADVAVIREYEENSVFDYLRFVDASGDNYTSKGVMANLSDRDYFKAGMKGESGITFVDRSRVTGEKQIGFYAPVYYEDDIIGIMVGFYGEKYINQLLEYELFDYKGEGWLCFRDGTVIGSTMDEDPENYLTYLKEKDRCTDEELQRITSHFSEGKDMAFTYMSGDDQATGYAVALSNMDWILIRTFPPSASRQILKNANREGIVLIMECVIMFAVYAIFIAVGILLNYRKMREENRNANDVSTGVSKLFEKFVTLDLAAGEYCYISGGMPADPNLTRQGSYEDFTSSILKRIPDEKNRKESSDFFRIEQLKNALMTSDRISFRVHAPIDGFEWFTYNFIVIERGKEDVPSRLLIVCQDVTALYYKEEAEQRQLQEALDRAEHASRAKTEFLFNMSHDLRTPMNAIIGYTELAQRDDVSKEDMRNYIGKIDSSSLHLLALINDILEMSRVESGKLTLDPDRTDLVRTMEETEEMFATQMAGKHIHFTVDTSAVKDRWVSCDKNRLNRIVLNLLSNACKFTNEHGEVSVILEQTGRETAEAGERGIYQLHVKDSGIGMNPEFVSKLFTPFERERTSTVSGIQGTGLGLSITKNIVELMEGSIDVITEQGRGTEFIVTLPFLLEAGEEDKPVEAQSLSEAVDFTKVRLLLVEDNPINREIASMILIQAGFMLEVAENGQIALDMVSCSQPGYYDAVLMDIQMPVMDGYTATKAIRALPDPGLSSVPIIAMTANAFKEDVEAARDAGMNGHIAKPLDVARMMETLTEVLSSQKNLKKCKESS